MTVRVLQALVVVLGLAVTAWGAVGLVSVGPFVEQEFEQRTRTSNYFGTPRGSVRSQILAIQRTLTIIASSIIGLGVVVALSGLCTLRRFPLATTTGLLVIAIAQLALAFKFVPGVFASPIFQVVCSTVVGLLAAFMVAALVIRQVKSKKGEAA